MNKFFRTTMIFSNLALFLMAIFALSTLTAAQTAAQPISAPKSAALTAEPQPNVALTSAEIAERFAILETFLEGLSAQSRLDPMRLSNIYKLEDLQAEDKLLEEQLVALKWHQKAQTKFIAKLNEAHLPTRAAKAREDFLSILAVHDALVPELISDIENVSTPPTKEEIAKVSVDAMQLGVNNGLIDALTSLFVISLAADPREESLPSEGVKPRVRSVLTKSQLARLASVLNTIPVDETSDRAFKSTVAMAKRVITESFRATDD